jgi:hypothetical protein
VLDRKQSLKKTEYTPPAKSAHPQETHLQRQKRQPTHFIQIACIPSSGDDQGNRLVRFKTLTERRKQKLGKIASMPLLAILSSDTPCALPCFGMDVLPW